MSQKTTLSVVLVDDEDHVRNLLEKTVPWERFDAQIVGSFPSGRELIDFTEKTIPDLVFLDLNMPGMDGMTLARWIRRKYPLVKVIVLTGFGDLETAKKGIEIGITSYLEKPIDPEDISRSLESIRLSLREEAYQRNEWEQHRQRSAAYQEVIKETALLRLLTEGDTNPDAPPWGSGPYQAALVDFPGSLSPGTCWEMLAFIRSMLKDRPQTVLCRESLRRSIIVNAGGSYFLNRLSEIYIAVRSRFGSAPNIAVGLEKLHWKNLRFSWNEAAAALAYGTVNQGAYVLWYGDIEDDITPRAHDEKSDDLAYAVKAGLIDQVRNTLEHNFVDIFSEKETSADNLTRAIQSRAGNLLSRILSVLGQSGVKAENLIDGVDDLYGMIMTRKTIPTLVDDLTRIAKAVGDVLHPRQKSQSEECVRRIEALMIQRLDDPDLSLASMAESVGKNPSYLSRIYKQHTGKTFVEHLTARRMNRAKELLKTTDLKAYEIAERVGILDAHYFGTIFRKHAGRSVSMYRKELISPQAP